VTGPESVSRSAELRGLALLFGKLGLIGFGGPAAHIALMRDEVVRRRGWLSDEEFLDLVGAVNLLPGPNSTELAIHIGERRAGVPGLLVAGACFILPAALLVLATAWAYVHYGHLPAVAGAWQDAKPVVVAIVLWALAGFVRVAVRSWTAAVVGVLALVLAAAGVHELAVLLAAGLAVLLLTRASWRAGAGAALAVAPVWTMAPSAAPGAAGLFLFFLKIGSVLYGSGYVLLAFLRSGLVERAGVLTETQLLDAVAAGQLTPGPVFTTATFIGYLLGGVPGAAAATAGIFLPAFALVGLGAALIPRLRRSPAARAFLQGVNVGSVALMALVTFQLGQAALTSWLAWLLGVGSLVLLRAGVNSAWLIAAGALAGIVLH
jgi:chromate transporter